MKATYKRYLLKFKRPSGTSRGVLTEKETWFLTLERNGLKGIGECGILRTLSIDDRPDYEEKLKWLCQNINLPREVLLEELIEFPSIQFGLEQALLSLNSQDGFELFPSDFTQGKKDISINGLIWMGTEEFMKEQIDVKLKEGFSCIKMKIGAIDFETELKLLKALRNNYSREEIELRVDANGAFKMDDAPKKLNELYKLGIHSIEQPITKGNWEDMARLCEVSPMPIALDEELIGIFSVTKKKELLQTIKPDYIILKPGLVGGFKGSQEWIDLCEEMNTGWWITSALESNIGLNAIAQWTYTLENQMPQGLGTGSLFTNNIDSPLSVIKGCLSYDPQKKWGYNLNEWQN